MPETSSYKGWTVEEPFLNLKCLLGEGPYFEKATNSLRFVDIKKKQLHTVPLESPRDTRTLQLDEPISATADIEGVDPARKIFVALKYGLAELNRLDGSYVYTHRFGGSKEEELRSNDGAVDPNGRFWVGTMTDFDMGQLRPEGKEQIYHCCRSYSMVACAALLKTSDKLTQMLGSLYCLDQSTNRKLCDNLTIPNTIGWSPDLKTMYFTNTATRQVLAYDYSVSDGEVSNERVFYQHDGPGEPDGFRVDVDGNIWHAIYGEGRGELP